MCEYLPNTIIFSMKALLLGTGVGLWERKGGNFSSGLAYALLQEHHFLLFFNGPKIPSKFQRLFSLFILALLIIL